MLAPPIKRKNTKSKLRLHLNKDGVLMRGIIDQFEEDWVIVEIEGETRDYKRAIFPEEAVVGDVVKIDGNQVTILKDETKRLRKEIEELMDEVWED